jgi:hypothetical protein
MTTTRALISSTYLILLLLAASAVPAAHAQQSQAPSYRPPDTNITNSSGNISTASTDSSPLANRMHEKAPAEPTAEHEQNIVSDSAHLLALAQKLNAEVARSNKNELSVSVVKEAAEVEKLAKSIKDKMRHGH